MMIHKAFTLESSGKPGNG